MRREERAGFGAGTEHNSVANPSTAANRPTRSKPSQSTAKGRNQNSGFREANAQLEKVEKTLGRRKSMAKRKQERSRVNEAQNERKSQNFPERSFDRAVVPENPYQSPFESPFATPSQALNQSPSIEHPSLDQPIKPEPKSPNLSNISSFTSTHIGTKARDTSLKSVEYGDVAEQALEVRQHIPRPHLQPSNRTPARE